MEGTKMQGSREDYYSLGEISNIVKYFLAYFRKRWWVSLIVAALGAGLGAVYYTVQKPKYESVCTFILEEKQSGMGGLSSIASQFGFDVGSIGGSGSIFAGDNILDILTSKKIVQTVLLTRLDTTSAQSQTLADLFIDFSKWKKKWRGRPALENVGFAKLTVPMTAVQDSVLNLIYDAVIKKSLIADRTSKKGTIIKVQVTSMNAQFARLMTSRLVDEASKMYLNIKTGNSQANINRMQRRSDSLLALLNNRSYAAASIQPLDANPGIKASLVPAEIATRDKSVIATVYTEVTKNLEASKMLLSQQTPVIQLLDVPGISFYDNKKKLIFLMITFAFVGWLVYFSYASFRYFISKKNAGVQQ